MFEGLRGGHFDGFGQPKSWLMLRELRRETGTQGYKKYRPEEVPIRTQGMRLAFRNAQEQAS